MMEETIYRENPFLTFMHGRLSSRISLPFDDIAEKIEIACQELGLPPVHVHRVDPTNWSYFARSGVAREEALGAPSSLDQWSDIAYIAGEFNGELYSTNTRRFPMTSVVINPWVFSDARQLQFQECLRNKGLNPQSESIYGLRVFPDAGVDKVYRQYSDRVPRYG